SLDKRADPAPDSSSYRGVASIADTVPPTFSEDHAVQSGGLLGHVDVPDEAPARAPQDMSEDPTATSGGPLGLVCVPDEAPARAPHDMSGDPTYMGGRTQGTRRSDGASRSWSAQWAARFAVIMAALGNWVSRTRVS
ncbi:unnamed protein product, partial [Ixodes hexagonus]